MLGRRLLSCCLAPPFSSLAEPCREGCALSLLRLPSDTARPCQNWAEVVAVNYFCFRGKKKKAFSHLFKGCNKEMEWACAGSKSLSQDTQN